MGENMQEDAHTKEKAVGRGLSRKRWVSRRWGDRNTSYAHMKQTGDFKKINEIKGS